uniref:WD_REPEATS_REGION domain-containing protein n=1 Tax=Caenorhabditis tropicalis TaxID=1561998 RepID=A0A1I7UZH2_9PELO
MDEENHRIDENEIDEIIEMDDDTDMKYASDDEDQQSTSNADVPAEIVDDSLMSLQAHSQDCFTVALASNRWLATGGEDDVAFLFDQSVSESEPVLKVEHKDSVTLVMFNNSETLLATGDLSGKIMVSEVATRKVRAEIDECNDLEWMKWHPTADILFAGDKDGILWMWLIGNKGIAQSKVYSGNGASCTVGCLMPDGKRILCGYSDGIVRMWLLREETSTHLYFHSPITAIDHHVTQTVAIVGTQSGTVNVINTSSPDNVLKKISLLPPPGVKSTTVTAAGTAVDEEGEEDEDVANCVESLAMAPSHPWFAVGRNDGSMCIYEMDSNAPRSIFQSNQMMAIVKVIWSMEGNAPYVTAGSIDGTVRVFDARDSSLVKELQNGGDEVLDVLVIQSNPMRIMTAGSGGVVRVFDLN